MKSFLLASTLLISGAAFAQTTSPTDSGQSSTMSTTTQPDATQSDPAAQSSPTTTQDPGAQTGTTMSSDPTGATGTMTDQTGAAQGTTGAQQGMSGAQQGMSGAQQGNMGTTGAGTTTAPAMMANAAPPPEPRASYPRCSRTVTDNCVQDESRARNTRRRR